jgi:hypothetical protein
MPREHGDDGEFVETITLDDVLEVFDAVDGPVILSADVADELGCTRETARRKLGALYERGDLNRRKVSRRVIYWRPETATSASRDAARADADLLPTETPADTVALESAGEGAESEAEFSTDDLRGDASNTLADQVADAPEPFDRDAWHDRLTEEVPRSDAVAERRADAILEMYDHLREYGEADNDTLAELVDPDAVNLAGADSIWSNLVKGKETLRTLPGVEPPPPSVDKPWRYQPVADSGEGEGEGGE